MDQRSEATHKPRSFFNANYPKYAVDPGSVTVATTKNCRLVEKETYFAIRLYSTDIIRYYADGTVSFFDGGYNSPTTSNRVAQFQPLLEGMDEYSVWGTGFGDKKLIVAGYPLPKGVTHSHDVRFNAPTGELISFAS